MVHSPKEVNGKETLAKAEKTGKQGRT